MHFKKLGHNDHLVDSSRTCDTNRCGVKAPRVILETFGATDPKFLRAQLVIGIHIA